MEVTKDFTKDFQQVISRFKSDDVLIGIPQSDEPREEGDPITNAAILAINHFGSDDGKIPPRDVLGTGIKNAQEAISAEMKKGAQEALKRGVSAIPLMFERVGTIASNSCKKVINDQDGLKPPSDATLKARKYITASGFKGTKSMLVTGQTRNAITYVVQTKLGA